MKKMIIFSALLMIFLTGCFQVNELFWEESHPISMVRPLIFQSEYTNHAWGYNHQGWMLDSSGQVRRFQKTAPWVFPDSLGYISEKDMDKNLSECDSVLQRISYDEFLRYSSKAIKCVDGPLTTPKNTMADAGEHIYAFYRYEADRKRYKRTILSMTGDWSQTNLAPDAREIVDWMTNIK